MSADLSPQQRRTLPAREAFDRRFSSDEERRAYFREIAAKSHADRIVLSGDEARALSEAYALIRRVAERVGVDGAAGDA